MKQFNSEWFGLSSLAACILISGCASNRQAANDTWRSEIESERYTVFSPVRSINELGNIITFDSSGREIIVARRDTCFPNIYAPQPVKVEFIKSTDKVESSSKISGNVADVLKNKVDLSFLASHQKIKSVSIKIISPKVSQYEMLLLKKEIGMLERQSDCYRALATPGNLLVYNTLTAEQVEYIFSDKSGQKLILTADILSQAKVSPELSRNSEGDASLIIDYPVTIGYRAIEARELPGLTEDKFDITIVEPNKVKMYQKLAKKD
jgi:hypothetical protein